MKKTKKGVTQSCFKLGRIYPVNDLQESNLVIKNSEKSKILIFTKVYLTLLLRFFRYIVKETIIKTTKINKFKFFVTIIKWDIYPSLFSNLLQYIFFFFRNIMKNKTL